MGRSITLPAEAYPDWSGFRWEQERFFDESGFCAGRSGDLESADDRRVVEWHGWSFANAGGNGYLEGKVSRPASRVTETGG